MTPLLLAATALLGGCQFLQGLGLGRGGDAPAAPFADALRDSTRAVSAGDLDQARVHLAVARSAAASDGERRKVESLEKLLDGAAALFEGDALQARAAWSAIEDPALRREVRRKADLIGVRVPATPAGAGPPGESEVRP